LVGLVLVGPVVRASAASIPGPRAATQFLGDPKERELAFQLDLSLWAAATASRETGLYAAYQQRSLWDIDNRGAPYRVETNFRPELGLAVGADTGRRILESWPRCLALSFAYAHESNGLEGDISRGWNRMIAGIHFGANGDRIQASLRGWVAFRVEDTNRDLRRDAGDGELRVVLRRGASSLHLRSAFSADARNGALFTNLEVGLLVRPDFLPIWVFPGQDGTPIDLVLEWFVGRGEYLSTPSASNNRIRLGIALRH
jgi:outer membrane phospholipase A